MKKINIWLMGGLGNVLFQLFMAEVLKKNGFLVNLIGTLVKENIYTYFLSWKIHEPLYEQFINCSIDNKKSLTLIFYALVKLFNIKTNKYIYYENINDIKKLKNKSNLFGYYQDKILIEKNIDIFKNFIDKIRKNTKNKERSYNLIHMRFGDITINKKLYSKTQIYYGEIFKLVKCSKIDYHVISDDISKAKDFFKECNNVVYIEKSSSINDFMILCNAKSLILSNSTFSWWGMHISENLEYAVLPGELFDKLGIHRNIKDIKVIN